MLLTQGCALTTPDFGPKTLVADEGGSCSTGHLLHAYPTIPDEGIGDLLFVQRTVDLGDMSGEGGSPASWTLADLPTPSPCTNPVSDLTLTANLANGRSAVGQASYELAQAGPFTVSDIFNTSAIAGTSATLIRVVGYNGQADDDLVEVDVVQGSCVPTPSWNGTDRWRPFIDYAKKMGADYTPTMFARAQIHGWTIDVKLDASRSPPYTRPIRLHATIRRADNRWSLSGAASAQVLTSEMLQLTQNLGVCPGTKDYDTVKSTYCSREDLDSDGDGICDSLSEAWTLKAEDARLGCMQTPPDAGCPTSAPSDDCMGSVTPGVVSPADAAK